MNDREQARQIKLNGILQRMHDEIAATTRSKLKIIQATARRYNGALVEVAGGKAFTLKLAPHTLRMMYKAWQQLGSAALEREFAAPGREIPDDLISEIRTRCTQAGADMNSAVIDKLLQEWRDGLPVAGLQTWPEWWAKNHPEIEPPTRAPKFPFCGKTLNSYCPKKKSALRKMGNLSLSAALEYLLSVERDSSGLHAGEVYVCDDVRLDLICHSAISGELTEVRAYLMMEWGTRRIVAFALRAGNALLECDVRALLARGLRNGGICRDRTTHIFLERGTVALSEDGENNLTLSTGGRVRIHRTGMISGERWAGAGKDKPIGNFRGKAPLESFMRQVHKMNRHLPGQRGNRYENQPGNLGFKGQGAGTEKDSIARWSESLARLEKSFQGRLKLKLEFLWEGDVEQALADGFAEFNGTRGHQMQGFSKQDIWQGRGVVTVNTPRSRAVIGYSGGRRFELGNITVEPGPTRQEGWSAITFTEMQPHHWLITATGEAENTGMHWKNAERNSVGREFGKAPTVVEGIPAAITMTSVVKVWALDERGQRMTTVPVANQHFEIGPPYRTLWYEMETR